MPAAHQPLTVGPYRVWPPVVLAPMAGITNPPFRALCRQQARSRVPEPTAERPAGLFV